MATRGHKSVVSPMPRKAHLRPTNVTVSQNRQQQNGQQQNGQQQSGQTDQAGRTEEEGTQSIVSENVYDQIDVTEDRAESGHNQYAAFLSNQNSLVKGIHTKLDSLESDQRRLEEQLKDSQNQILSELSQVKEMVNSLSELVKTSIATFQRSSAEQDQRVQELATNLGQEVFHIGQEVMVTIRERNDEDMAIRTWRQQLETDRLSSLSKDSKKNSKKNELPSL